MDIREKLDLLAPAFDCEGGSLSPETALDALGWDSMAKLSVIALVKARFGRRLSGADLRAFTTVRDILDKME